FMNYVVGVFIDDGRHKSKAALIVGLILNIGIIAVFKYADFLAETLNAVGVPVPKPGIALPIGISFFTFQSISYIIDVYRGQVRAQKDFFSLLLYISMFPQLIAGPIVRYSTISAEINRRSISMHDLAEGSFRFLVGLGKKVILANQLGELSAAFLDGDFASLSTGGAWIGILAYTMQIYFDFSGYSDMAIGMGRCMGFHFDENFNYPYVTRTITEFWRRWHISLGSFFRDYVYIPMGGNRRHQPLNILVVWFLTGLWHGASWNFVLWGLYFGAIIMLEKYTIVKIQDRIPGFILHIYSLFIIVFGWVIFYFTDISRMGGFIGILFGGGASGWNLVAQNELTGNLWLIIAGIVCCLPIGKGIRSIYEKAAYDGSAGAEVLLTGAKTLCAAALLVSCTLLLIGSTTNPFLYLRF
ncbi:MAG: MBOAT family O-acyltransferase, partial [Oscillospiraceae bacterium]